MIVAQVCLPNYPKIPNPDPYSGKWVTENGILYTLQYEWISAGDASCCKSDANPFVPLG